MKTIQWRSSLYFCSACHSWKVHSVQQVQYQATEQVLDYQGVGHEDVTYIYVFLELFAFITKTIILVSKTIFCFVFGQFFIAFVGSRITFVMLN